MKEKTCTKEKLDEYVDKKYWAIFLDSTKTVSSISRQLAFGIGGTVIAWDKLYNLIKNTCALYIIFSLLLLFFILDATQYVVSTWRYSNLADEYERKIERGEIKNISQLGQKIGMNTIPNFLFYLKFLVISASGIMFFILITMLSRTIH